VWITNESDPLRFDSYFPEWNLALNRTIEEGLAGVKWELGFAYFWQGRVHEISSSGTVGLEFISQKTIKNGYMHGIEICAG
jgi:hypothetical protein